MKVGDEVVITAHPVKKRGIKISKPLYDLIVNYIIRNIQNYPNVTLTDLLLHAEEQFKDITDVHMYIYNVKLDLEAKGFVRNTSLNTSANAGIKFTSQGLKHFGKIMTRRSKNQNTA